MSPPLCLRAPAAGRLQMAGRLFVQLMTADRESMQRTGQPLRCTVLCLSTRVHIGLRRFHPAHFPALFSPAWRVLRRMTLMAIALWQCLLFISRVCTRACTHACVQMHMFAVGRRWPLLRMVRLAGL